YGFVAPYASSGADVEPDRGRGRRSTGRLTQPDPEGGVSAAEFEQMKRDIAEEEAETPRRRASTLTQRLARTGDGEGSASGVGGGGPPRGGAGGRGARRAPGAPPGAGPPRPRGGGGPATPPPSSIPPIDPE